VSIEGTTQTFEIASNAILYDALADQGLDLPHGCLAGSCGACRINVISGVENLSKPGAIEQNTIEAVCTEYREKIGEEFLLGKTIRLSCRAKVTGDVCITPLGQKTT
jgi:ferredoxin